MPVKLMSPFIDLDQDDEKQQNFRSRTLEWTINRGRYDCTLHPMLCDLSHRAMNGLGYCPNADQSDIGTK